MQWTAEAAAHIPAMSLCGHPVQWWTTAGPKVLFHVLLLKWRQNWLERGLSESSAGPLSHLCSLSLHRNSRQSLQPVQWLHQWEGAADGLQHPDGNSSSLAIQSPAPLQLPLWEVWRLRLAQRGWAGPEVRLIRLRFHFEGRFWRIFHNRCSKKGGGEGRGEFFFPLVGYDLFKSVCRAVWWRCCLV